MLSMTTSHRPGAPQTRPCDTPIEPGCDWGWLGRVWEPGARPPAGGTLVEKLKAQGQIKKKIYPRIYHPKFLEYPFCTLNDGRSRGARSVGVVQGGAAWPRVCMVHGGCVAQAAVPRTPAAPGGGLVSIGVVQGRRQAKFTAWGVREGAVS
jgi:hypothetical protein